MNTLLIALTFIQADTTREEVLKHRLKQAREKFRIEHAQEIKEIQHKADSTYYSLKSKLR